MCELSTHEYSMRSDEYCDMNLSISTPKYFFQKVPAKTVTSLLSKHYTRRRNLKMTLDGYARLGLGACIPNATYMQQMKGLTEIKLKFDAIYGV